MKTRRLFKKYFELLDEQDRGLDSALPDATNPPTPDTPEPDVQPEPEISAVGDTSGEQYMLRLALAALITTPDIDDMGYVAEITKKLDSGNITPDAAADLLKKRILLHGGTSEVKQLLGVMSNIQRLPKTDAILNKL
jgi:hypothetical protein